MNLEFGIENLEFVRAFQIPNSKFLILTLALFASVPAAAQQTFTGRLSDSLCGASHHSKASAGALTDRACLTACINALAKYVLVDEHNQVIPIANQDAMGLPLYAGRPVKLK